MDRRRLVLLVMCAGYFLVLLDVTIVNVALPRIAAGLGASRSGLQWTIDAYAIALASLMLAGGTLGDRRGHKRIVLAGLGVFGAASAACALAPSVGALVAARALQGLGAALMLPGTLAVITRAHPARAAQARAIGVWAGVGSSALAIGPVLGGVLTGAFGWRAVFVVNLPVVAIAALVAARVVEETRDEAPGALDRPGAALGAAALATVTFACIDGGREGLTAPVVAAAVAALALGGLFARAERRSPDPMLPLGLLRRPPFRTANALAGTMNLVTLGTLFVLTLFLQGPQGRSPLAAGIALLPLFAPLSVLAPLGGRIVARTGPRMPTAGGLLLAGAGIASLAALGTDAPYLALLPGLLAWGIGLGFLTPAVVATALAAVPAAQSGLASAVNNTARQAGGAIGIAAFGALGLHAAALVGGGLYLLGAGVAAYADPG
jgi:DHA2 family methylenomycin A resistance protein-like MFS transporter